MSNVVIVGERPCEEVSFDDPHTRRQRVAGQALPRQRGDGGAVEQRRLDVRVLPQNRKGE